MGLARGARLMAKPKPSRLAKLEDELKQRDARIRELRADLNKAEMLISEEREHVESANAAIEAWIEAFDMVQDENGKWTYAPWVDNCVAASKRYDELVKKWNRHVTQFNRIIRPRNVGRPLGANEAQIAQVRKLRQAGKSLRGIAAVTDLRLATVRTILDRDSGSDRMTKKRWQKLHPGEKWEDRDYTPVSELARIEAKREEPWRERTRRNLPKRITETLDRGHELVKAAKGLR